jgi:hypothetical protein
MDKFKKYLQDMNYGENTIRQYLFCLQKYMDFVNTSTAKESINLIQDFLENQSHEQKTQSLSVIKLYFVFTKNPLLFELEKGGLK